MKILLKNFQQFFLLAEQRIEQITKDLVLAAYWPLPAQRQRARRKGAAAVSAPKQAFSTKL